MRECSMQWDQQLEGITVGVKWERLLYTSPKYSSTQLYTSPNTAVHSCTPAPHTEAMQGQITPYLSCVADCLFYIVVNQGNIEKEYEYSSVLLYETLPARFIHKVEYEYKRSILSKPSAYTMCTVDSAQRTVNCVQYTVNSVEYCVQCTVYSSE